MAGKKGQMLWPFLLAVFVFLVLLAVYFALIIKGTGTPEPGSGGFLYDWIAGIFG